MVSRKRRLNKRSSRKNRLETLERKLNIICKINSELQSVNEKTQTGGSFFGRVKYFINNNRAFSAFCMILLNIGSRYVNLNITTSQEFYLRKFMQPEFIIFAISWMGSRDVFTALIITLLYTLMSRYFLNENSSFCIFKEKMQTLRRMIDTNNDKKISDDELEKAIKILAKMKNQDEEKEQVGDKKDKSRRIISDTMMGVNNGLIANDLYIEQSMPTFETFQPQVPHSMSIS